MHAVINYSRFYTFWIDFFGGCLNGVILMDRGQFRVQNYLFLKLVTNDVYQINGIFTPRVIQSSKMMTILKKASQPDHSVKLTVELYQKLQHPSLQEQSSTAYLDKMSHLALTIH